MITDLCGIRYFINTPRAIFEFQRIAFGDIGREDFACYCRSRNGNINRDFCGTCGYKEINIAIDFCIFGNGDCTVIGILTRVMNEDCSVCAFNHTAVDRQNILRFRSIQELTDCSIGGFDHAAVDHGFRIRTFSVGQIINGVSHIRSAKVFDRAVFNHKLSARIVRNHNGRSIPIAIGFSRQRNLTVTRNGEFASVVKQIEVTRNIIVGTCNRFSVQVKRYFFGVLDRFGKSNICQKRDGFAILCCFKCFREGFIFLITDLCDTDKIFTLGICRLRAYTQHTE